MNRLELIKTSFKKLKRREFKLKPIPIPKVVRILSDEEKAARLISKNEYIRVYKKTKISNGVCVRCSKHSIKIKYEYDGILVLERQAKFCPLHWESEKIRTEMQNAISSNSTNYAGNDMDSSSLKSNKCNGSSPRNSNGARSLKSESQG